MAKGVLVVLGALAVALSSAPARPQGQNAASPDSAPLGSAVVQLLDSPPLPTVSMSPNKRFALLVEERGLLPLRSLAEPALEIGHLRVNPQTYGPHAPLNYFGLSQVDLTTGEAVDISLPRNVTLSFPRWSPDGSQYAFSVTGQSGIELWVGEPRAGRVDRLVGPVLNATTGNPCVWMPDGYRLLCRTVPESRRSVDPLLMSNYRLRPGQAIRTEPSSLSNGVIAQLLESQLVLVDTRTGSQRAIGLPSAFESVEPAPSGAYLLVRRMTAPYTDLARGGRPNRVLEIWDITGRVAHAFTTDMATSVARAAHWHASSPATVVWAEGSEAGDSVLMQSAPFVGDPVELFRPPHGFAGLMWLEGEPVAIVRDFDARTRITSLWLVTSDAARTPPRLLDTRSIDSPHSTAFMPITRLNAYGETVVAVHDHGIFLRNSVADGDSVRHALDFFDLRTRERRELWTSASRHYEPIIDLLADDGSSVLTRRESIDEPPSYLVHDLDKGSERPLTDRRQPFATPLDARRIPLRYTRADGRELSAILYVPGQASSAEPLPVVLWAYPREFGTDTSSLGVASPERYLDFKRAFRLFFLLRGYAVMDEVAMPIVGEPGQANDSFIEQIVDNASAALTAAADTGFVDPSRAGIAGHSYGAFMVANLLAHSRLFEAGVAMSGAYNRTLTPFGFQTERRSLWDARELYLAMSPFLYSNQIEAPLLLIHGLQDDNAGTQPMQSEQFYNAIRYNGGQAELLLLPFEGHNYRARESVLQSADAMLGWFDRYLKTANTRRAGEDHLASVVSPSG